MLKSLTLWPEHESALSRLCIVCYSDTMLLYESSLLLAVAAMGAWAANICGTIGIHNSSKVDYYMGNFFYKGPSIFTLCASYCKKDSPKCKSFRYSYWGDAAGQYCEFFDNGL